MKEILLLFCFSLFTSSQSEKILVSIHVISRHGDREPVFEVGKFKPFSSNCRGVLIDKGKDRMLNIGKGLRDYYGKNLSVNFQNSSYYFQSTDYNRTAESMKFILNGLFPKLSEESLLNIPISRPSLKEDIELHTYSSCMQARHMFDKNAFKRKEYMDVCKKYQDVLDKYSKAIGEKASCHIQSLKIDTLEAFHNNGMPLPEGVLEEDYRFLVQFKEESFKLLHTFNSEDCNSLVGAFFSKVFFEHPQAVSEYLQLLLPLLSTRGNRTGNDSSAEIEKKKEKKVLKERKKVDVLHDAFNYTKEMEKVDVLRDAFNYTKEMEKVDVLRDGKSVERDGKGGCSSSSTSLCNSSSFLSSILHKRPPLYHHYSAHDLTLVDITGCLGIGTDFAGLFPHYGAVFAIETYLDVNLSDSNWVESVTKNPSFSVRFLHDFSPSCEGPLRLAEISPADCRGQPVCSLQTLRTNYTAAHRDVVAGTFVARHCAITAPWLTGYYWTRLRIAVRYRALPYKHPVFICGCVCVSVCGVLLVWLCFYLSKIIKVKDLSGFSAEEEKKE